MRMLRACLIAGTLATAAGAAWAQEPDCDAVADELREALGAMAVGYPRRPDGGYDTGNVVTFMERVLPRSIPAECVESVGTNLQEEPQTIVPPEDFGALIRNGRLIISIEVREYYKILGFETSMQSMYVHFHLVVDSNGRLGGFLVLPK